MSGTKVTHFNDSYQDDKELRSKILLSLKNNLKNLRKVKKTHASQTEKEFNFANKKSHKRNQTFIKNNEAMYGSINIEKASGEMALKPENSI